MSAPSSVELTVIAPCLNEELNVPTLVRRVLQAFDTLSVPAELVLVDDGSRDATWARIEGEMAKDPRVRGARHPTNRGIVEGWVSGLDVARGRLVCLIDSDLQNRPEDIPRLLRAYQEEQPDIVQAVRHPHESEQRMLFSRGLNLLLNTSFGMRLRDNKSGFILCKREVLAAILKDRRGYRYFQSFIGVAGGLHGYRFVEVDTTFESRHAGDSFLGRFPVTVSLRVALELVRFRLATLTRRR